jgi:hypothetical protein
MSKVSDEEAWHLSIHLIEEQLQVLPITIASILKPADVANVEPRLLSDNPLLKRKPSPAKTGSGGNIVAHGAEPNEALDLRGSHQALHDDPHKKANYIRIVVSNALLAVGMFLREHNMASMRTPEIQFFDHVLDAILNANRFDVEPGYLPMATFDGLVIDSSLNGKPLFNDGTTEGFMEFGDALALLQWLSRYLRGEKKYVSGGDAG